MNFSSLPLRRFAAALVVIAGGFFLRAHGHAHKIPAFYIKYGYWVLWAAAIYFLLALLLRSRPQNQILFIGALLCALVEFSKLSHTPALEIFRLTQTGAWLLGRTYSVWNFLAYAAGLALAWGLDGLLGRVGAKKSRAKSRAGR